MFNVQGKKVRDAYPQFKIELTRASKRANRFFKDQRSKIKDQPSF